jgi:hypothetical protein
MAKPNLRLVPPDSELRTVTLRRRSNSEMGRDRERLTELEVERLVKVAKGTRHGHRDATMILRAMCARGRGQKDLAKTLQSIEECNGVGRERSNSGHVPILLPRL